jgi:hypothetical protein
MLNRVNAKIGTFLALWWATAFGQTFEAADVQASPRAANPCTYASGGVLRGGRYDLRKATMLDLIKTARGVDSQRHPADAGVRADCGEEQTEAGGIERFRTCRMRVPQPPAPSASRFFACRAIAMDAFAQRLRQMAGDYLAAPVVNDTGLEGAWDFDLKWNPRSRILQPDASRTTIFDAVDRQLGLKLAPKTAPGPVLVVDRVNERPTPNPPDTAKILPRGAIEFEVAALKLSRPGEPDLARVSGDRYEVHARSPGILLYDAFDVPFSSEYDLIAGIPKSVATSVSILRRNCPSGPPGPRETRSPTICG